MSQTAPPASRPPRRRRRSVALAAALGVGAALAALPAAAGAQAPTVMAKIVGGTGNADEVAARTGLALQGTIPQIGWATYAVEGDVAAAHQRLLNDPAVSRIDFVAPGEQVDLDFTPRDTIFLQPGTVVAGQLQASWNWHWTITNFPAGWDVARGDGNTRVAVIDSEFDTEHLELKPKLLTGKNFDSGTPEYRTGNVRATPNDLGTLHGSHVAGLVGAVSDNANGVTGACLDCVVIPYKISLRGGPPGATETSDAKFVRDLTEALVDIAGRGDVRVVNMSLGTTRFHQPMQDAVNLALSSGKILVAAAGNDQLSQPGVAHYPASFPGVIGVGATQPDDNIAPFSTNGDFVDVSAPGHGILSTWDQRIPQNAQPPVTAPTHGIGFTVLSGTSMASPITAGLIALMLQLRPDLTSAEVQALLERSAVDLGATGKDPVFGAGRIDASAALRAAQAYVRPTPPPPPPPAPDPRAAVRFFWSCEQGSKDLAAGKPFIGVPVRAKLVCKGRTAPAVRKAVLEIQRYSARGGWKRIGVLRTTNKGRFGFTRRLTSVGNWRIRVAFAGNAALLPSGALGIKARAVPRRR